MLEWYNMGNSVAKGQETCDTSLDESSYAFRACVDQDLCSTQVINENDSQTIVWTNTQPFVCTVQPTYCTSTMIFCCCCCNIVVSLSFQSQVWW